MEFYGYEIKFHAKMMEPMEEEDFDGNMAKRIVATIGVFASIVALMQ